MAIKKLQTPTDKTPITVDHNPVAKIRDEAIRDIRSYLGEDVASALYFTIKTTQKAPSVTDNGHRGMGFEIKEAILEVFCDDTKISREEIEEVESIVCLTDGVTKNLYFSNDGYPNINIQATDTKGTPKQYVMIYTDIETDTINKFNLSVYPKMGDTEAHYDMRATENTARFLSQYEADGKHILQSVINELRDYLYIVEIPKTEGVEDLPMSVNYITQNDKEAEYLAEMGMKKTSENDANNDAEFMVWTPEDTHRKAVLETIRDDINNGDGDYFNHEKLKQCKTGITLADLHYTSKCEASGREPNYIDEALTDEVTMRGDSTKVNMDAEEKRINEDNDIEFIQDEELYLMKRVVAKQDFVVEGVEIKKGQIGGLVEHEDNISLKGAWIGEGVIIRGEETRVEEGLYDIKIEVNDNDDLEVAKVLENNRRKREQEAGKTQNKNTQKPQQ